MYANTCNKEPSKLCKTNETIVLILDMSNIKLQYKASKDGLIDFRADFVRSLYQLFLYDCGP